MFVSMCVFAKVCWLDDDIAPLSICQLWSHFIDRCSIQSIESEMVRWRDGFTIGMLYFHHMRVNVIVFCVCQRHKYHVLCIMHCVSYIIYHVLCIILCIILCVISFWLDHYYSHHILLLTHIRAWPLWKSTTFAPSTPPSTLKTPMQCHVAHFSIFPPFLMAK